MSRSIAYKTLLEIEAAELKRVADQLNLTGLATDEDGLCLSSSLVEHWSDDCTELLRDHGYQGGKLLVTGRFFNHCGAIYLLYQSSSHSLEDAQRELERAAKRHATA